MSQSQNENQVIHVAVSKLISEKLKSVKTLNRQTQMQIYNEIFNVWSEITTNAKFDLSNEAVNYLAQQYYSGILINGRQELDMSIFTQLSKVESISTKELLVIGSLLRGTDFLLPVVKEIKRRN